MMNEKEKETALQSENPVAVSQKEKSAQEDLKGQEKEKQQDQEKTKTVVRREEEEDTRIYKVVVNHEEQYSIWFADREIPKGWREDGTIGTKKECLAHIKEVWTDMRPLSLRKKMEEMERKRPELEREHARKIEEEKKKPKDPRDNLVKYLSEGTHPVEAGLRPEKTVKIFKEAIDRGYVHVKYTDTRGGTELGFRLDNETCDFAEADFEKGTGNVHVEGTLVLNYVKVRCIADIKLESLEGEGYLVILEDQNGKVTFKQGEQNE